MHVLRLAATVFAMLGGLSLVDSTRGEERSEPVVIKIRICEQWPGKKEPMVLTEPMLQTMVGGQVWIEIGKHRQPQPDTLEHPIGLKLNAKIERRVNEKYELQLKIVQGAQRQIEDDPETEIFTEEKLSVHTWAERGKMKKISISPIKWCEVTLEDPRQTAAVEQPNNAKYWRGYTAVPSTAAPELIARPPVMVQPK
ncbi:hypothetical protein [Blastopirellula marina]|uniref:Uncharacterized protein n=1 Tax=Blastopirellula marina TaxID=124 RepID=A0A2S8G999_9BACT|nr:hypothetical protein [Blastopirellula marina]PQO40880.1 hypothetical protein C5Y98_04690 [Blastopirellula marina]PTL45762.1 hypothetical protein C5Y97_04690 [Blastopirellula marina]